MAVCVAHRWIQSYDASEIFDGKLVLPNCKICESTIQIRQVTVGVNDQRLCVVLKAKRNFSLPDAGTATANICIGVLPVQLNCLVIVIDGFVKLTIKEVGTPLRDPLIFCIK